MVLGATFAAAPVQSATTATPIQHVVVIFQENVSFDHYFATYPVATNPPGEPAFTAAAGTPSVNGLSGALLTNNPNLANPARLDRSQAVTCDQGHNYNPEQKSVDGGLMDKFVQYTGNAGAGCNPNIVMDYYDGNTVSALWNYAQNFAMSDNSFGTAFGPSTPGVLNLVSGETAGATLTGNSTSVANGVVINDLDPTFDDCSAGATAALSGQNIGNLLNNAGITWGWFQGGFAPSTNATATTKAVCNTAHANINGSSTADYSAHHEPFQYYASTSNPHHLPPSSPAMIGKTDQANHQYDISQFWVAANAGNMPAVSYLKAPKYQDGHPGYSDPLDEQTFLVNTINSIEKLPTWSSTAIVIAYDDSDGWYDHVMPPIVIQSSDPKNDALLGATGLCGTTKPGTSGDQCGYGIRMPLLVISPYAKANFVDNTLTDQSSILRFIEDNWNLGRIGTTSADNLAGPLTNMFNFNGPSKSGALTLDPATGEVVSNTLTSASTIPIPAGTTTTTVTATTTAPGTTVTSLSTTTRVSTAPGATQTVTSLSTTTMNSQGGNSSSLYAVIGILAVAVVGLGVGLVVRKPKI
jgi:phospholipase C